MGKKISSKRGLVGVDTKPRSHLFSSGRKLLRTTRPCWLGDVESESPLPTQLQSETKRDVEAELKGMYDSCFAKGNKNSPMLVH